MRYGKDGTFRQWDLLGWDPLEWDGNPFGHDPPDGWNSNTLRLFWTDMRWSRIPLVMVLTLRGFVS